MHKKKKKKKKKVHYIHLQIRIYVYFTCMCKKKKKKSSRGEHDIMRKCNILIITNKAFILFCSQKSATLKYYIRGFSSRLLRSVKVYTRLFFFFFPRRNIPFSFRIIALYYNTYVNILKLLPHANIKYLHTHIYIQSDYFITDRLSIGEHFECIWFGIFF